MRGDQNSAIERLQRLWQPIQLQQECALHLERHVVPRQSSSSVLELSERFVYAANFGHSYCPIVYCDTGRCRSANVLGQHFDQLFVFLLLIKNEGGIRFVEV